MTRETLALATVSIVLLIAGCGGTGAASDGAVPDARSADAPSSDGVADVRVDAPDAPDTLDDGGRASRCTQTVDTVSCPLATRDVVVAPGIVRKVHFQLPLGTPPAGGWAPVILFQGSLFSSALDARGTKGEPFGAYYQALLIKELLDGGYAVLAPEAHAGGSTFWDTNVPPWSDAWDGAPDDLFVRAIFASIEASAFGPLDASRMHATGISSGGYMTSRMAMSYPGRFRSLAIASASYASCSGSSCTIPSPLPADHPPTLFLHGQRDSVVPIATMERYRDQLVSEGHVAQSVVDPTAGHEWIAAAPDAVVAWFDASP